MLSLFDSALCGDFTYDATYESFPITDSTLPPLAYDPSNRMFSVFANDINLAGTKTITVTGYFVLHSSNTFTITFELDMITPCG